MINNEGNYESTKNDFEISLAATTAILQEEYQVALELLGGADDLMDCFVMLACLLNMILLSSKEVTELEPLEVWADYCESWMGKSS